MRQLTVACAVGSLLLWACGASATAPPASQATAVPSQAPTSAVAPSAAVPSPATAAPATAAPPATAVPSPTLGFTPGTKAKPRVVDIGADDTLTFFPNVVRVAEGETVTFQIKNAGKANHEFMLGPLADAFADKEGTPEAADIGAGETKSLTFTFTGPGPYAFACHEPGHFEVGMLGYVVVIGPDVPAVGTAANPRLAEVEMNDQLRFIPDQISVAKGETVTFLLTNEGTATHEFAVGPADKVNADEVDGKIVLEADEIDGHHLKTITYTFGGPAPFAFACHEPGHFEAGMHGTIVFAGP